MVNNVIDIALAAFRAGVYKKNIHYIFKEGANPEEFRMAKALAGSPGMANWVIQQAHRIVGVQMQVAKDVSTDLVATDFGDAANIENIPWPAPVVELYFEDPLLPTILLMKSTPDQLRNWFPQLEIGIEEPHYITALMQEGNDPETSTQLSLQLNPSMYESFLMRGEAVEMAVGLFSARLSDQDNFAMAYMLNLALKVFVFASIPEYRAKPITTKDMTRKFGGKPNVQGRPARPTVRLEYLPKVILPKK